MTKPDVRSVRDEWTTIAPTPSATHCRKGEAGAVAIEYALVGVLVGIAFLAAATALGVEVENLFRFVLEAVAGLLP